MTDPLASQQATVRTAMVCSFAMIANQIASKAVRDTLFLSSFGIEALPTMVVGAAVTSLAFVLLASRLLLRRGPGRIVPGAFLVSTVVLLGVAGISGRFPRLAAVVLYLHVAALGAILVSWFWSLLNECFDARTGRRNVGRIAAGGTFGGLLAGLATERLGAVASPDALLPVLALLHAVCAWMTARIVRRNKSVATQPPSDTRPLAGLRILRRSSYLRTLASLILLGTLGATLLDFAFKAKAAEALTDPRALLRFFAIFYAATAFLGFVVQSLLVTRLLKTPQDLSRSISLLPLCLSGGAFLAILFPGLLVLSVARGFESILRNSAFRSSYEIFFNPLPPQQKRATKTIIDVGCDRTGDLLGGLFVQALIVPLGLGVALPYLLGTAVAIGLLAAWRVRRLHSGYVGALEDVLREQVTHGSRADDAVRQTAELFRSQVVALHPTETSLSLPVLTPLKDAPLAATSPAAAQSPPATTPDDTAAQRLLDLQSRHPDAVQRALADPAPLTLEMADAVIPLLAWDLMYRAAAHALQRNLPQHVPRLVEALLDPESDFAIRRRIPAILATTGSPGIVAALLQSLSDARFEVRYQCALALARIHRRNPELRVDRGRVLEVITQEAQVDQKMWNRRRLLDAVESENTPFYRDVLRNRTHRSLEHLFHLLSLQFPAEPLRVAYDGLHTGDPVLRGTALEYLESILPEAVRRSLWPLLGSEPEAIHARKSEQELLESLFLSHQSILLQLKDLEGREE